MIIHGAMVVDDVFQQFCLRASASGSDGDEEGKMMWREKDQWKINFSGEKPATPLLDTINYPAHMKNLSSQVSFFFFFLSFFCSFCFVLCVYTAFLDLEQLAAELRADIVYTVSKTGGHLSSSLGVVELAVALHHVFNTPEDKIIWDVGHQAYPHKILTGRRSRMHTIRKTSGLAGFPKRDESIYDAFGAGHSSTSISAGLGMAVGRDLLGKKNNVISVIGDGAMTAGQAYEAMNNAGYLDANLIVVLNDNKQVSLPTATLDGPATPVGALSSALAKLQASTNFRKLREAAKGSSSLILKQASNLRPNPLHLHILAAFIDDRPSCFRFPRGNGIGVTLPPNNKGTPLEIGKGRILLEGCRVAILGYGSMVQQCLQAASMLKSRDISVTVADARFCKPLDTDLIKRLASEHEILLTVEEGSIGGFGSHVSHYLSLTGILDGPLKLRAMVLPDRYIDHGAPQDQMEEAGLSARHISATILSLLGRPKEALQFK
ncbi:hypothetical protein FH972_006865 [Carpinus fangiana]|uniref:Transketolase C-terminal domain-containing protein n=1 Tax=Carpinus fangiana TaxID=176857 RepID=A0A5N6QTT9_9ROSI|nr:hypothetical protein FH972_006865 [Carpinus fangiana]